MKNQLKKKIKKVISKNKRIIKKLKKKKLTNIKYKLLNSKYRKTESIKNYYEDWKKYKKLKKESLKLFEIEEIKKLAEEDFKFAEQKIKLIEKKLKNKLIKKKLSQKIFLEIKTGVGGDESAIFASDLTKMYIKYSEKKNWKIKIISKTPTNLGGWKEIILFIKGKNVYKNLKLESGVHRVQRKPITENQNKIHTSTCRIAVTNKINSKIFKIDKKDFKIDTYKSSGAGGQHVNKTNSAVRIKHIPTGITVECQNERSQHKNKKQAIKLIKKRIKDYSEKKEKKLNNNKKKFLLGKGERSEKIRTYNYTKNRITDHRINFTIHKLDQVINGNLELILEKLKNYKKINVVNKKN